MIPLAPEERGGTGGVGGNRGGEPTPPEDFVPGDPVTVSTTSPFAECSADFNPDVTLFPDSEVEPWLVVNPNDPDHMAATWQQDRYSGGACRGNVVSVSFDGGAAWQQAVLPKLAPCSGGEWERAPDPWLAFAANGDLYSASLAITRATGDEPKHSGMLVHKSVDGGLTWGDPVLVHSSDPAGLAVQIVVLPDGTLVAVFVDKGPTISESPIFVKRSTDRGATWPGEPIIAATQSFVLPRLPDGDDTVRSGLIDIGMDRDTGDLHMVWEQFTDRAPPVGVAYSSSSDGGLTWSTPIRIDRTPSSTSFELEQAFLPSVEVSDDGTIGVTYYNFQNDTLGDSRSDSDVWFIHCHPDFADCNDAESWSNSKRLTPESFDYLAAPDSNLGYFLGDYVGLASAGRDFVTLLSVTTDDNPADAIFVPIRGE